MVYAPGKQHNFILTVNKRAQGSYEFSLSGESITVWENDRNSHEGIAREYVVVDVQTPGTLDACISAKGLKISKVRNLKVTGTINSRDFAVMKYKMSSLSAVNLKEVTIAKTDEDGTFGRDINDQGYYHNDENCIPDQAFQNKNSLTSIILPDKLVSIRDDAFADCSGLTGSLIFPEGLESIGPGAFRDCKNMCGKLEFPSSLLETTVLLTPIGAQHLPDADLSVS